MASLIYYIIYGNSLAKHLTGISVRDNNEYLLNKRAVNETYYANVVRIPKEELLCLFYKNEVYRH